MHITRLRLLGFKSFVEPTELLVEPGLTGVVGPNGCGKSNLLEALRWVMGETSYKTMRASAMDDVIFAGTQSRPARNTAEVTIFLDNSARTAPAAFNDSDSLEITRKIEREAGSAYRINGKDVRARDVQLLFADASTGARSPALVQQGQIGEIVNAKPQARRRILEEAAGITGLHSRRHEAELRLRAAESNLERLQDIMGQIGSRLNSLKRQARQAKRYKELSTLIQQAEAIQHHLNWVTAGQAVQSEEEALQEALKEVGLHTQGEAEALRAQAGASEALQPLRDEEATRAAVLHRLNIERDTLEKEEARANARQQELKDQLGQLERDFTREQDLIGEAKDILARLEQENAELTNATVGRVEAEATARATLEAAAAELSVAESKLTEVAAQAADHKASRRQLEETISEQQRQIERGQAQQLEIDQQYESLNEQLSAGGGTEPLAQQVERLAEELAKVEQDVLAAEDAHTRAREQGQEKREQAAAAKLSAQKLTTEVLTLTKLLMPETGNQWRPILDNVRVTPGYELALGAALGDDLDAAADTTAPAHWTAITGQGDQGLPEDVATLAQFVQAPQELARRLAQIGIVTRDQGQQLQSRLLPGQRLVSREGDLWRWDGFTTAADAPTASAKRLSERNRLEELNREMAAAEALSVSSEHEKQEALAAAQAAQAEEKRLRAVWRQTQNELDEARNTLTKSERLNQETNKKLAALAEAKSRIRQGLKEAETRKAEAEAALVNLAPTDELDRELASHQAQVSERRTVFTEARASVAGLEREMRLRQERLEAIAEEKERWLNRSKSADAQVENLQVRIEKTRIEVEDLKDLPEQIAERRQKLLSEMSKAEETRKQAADALATAENALREVDQGLRDVQGKLATAREDRARIEARLEAARERRTEQARHIRDGLGCAPEDCLKLAGLEDGEDVPNLQEIERRLQKHKADRERLGGVNLRAEEETEELTQQFEEMERERDDLEQAIARLRQGISNLNKEGRKRLLEAFDIVNGHFQKLFKVLFGGGEAELQLIESDDPLEAGLEIVARPPGKKPQVLTLLSGGEKALTAMSLIFAVFLTNPSPICVLDEVDAPLDDSNVERFCNMMEEMVASTETRFLVITHHPMTMARVDRLFGVTMAEKGVSQLVSVDLATAESYREAS